MQGDFVNATKARIKLIKIKMTSNLSAMQIWVDYKSHYDVIIID